MTISVPFSFIDPANIVCAEAWYMTVDGDIYSCIMIGEFLICTVTYPVGIVSERLVLVARHVNIPKSLVSGIKEHIVSLLGEINISG